MKRKFVFYAGVLFLFALVFLLVWQAGIGLEDASVRAADGARSQSDPLGTWLRSIVGHLLHEPGLLLVQILVIVTAAQVFGSLFERFGQPPVTGEIFAGILLGPSLLGALFPSFSTLLFPAQSLGGLHLLSQVGLILFMFVIGMELDPALLRKRADSAVLISHISIVAPFALGMMSALVLYSHFAPRQVAFLSFALFMGIAMSITAFPVLARILHDRDLARTPAGALSLACAAADDVTAWSILAVVIALVRAGDALGGLATLLAAGTYVLFMFLLARPLLRRVGEVYASRESLTGPVVAAVFLFLFASSLLTQAAGVHALFGAFLAGAMMPERGPFRRLLTERVHDVSVILLLPLFFALTGLRTQIGLLNSPELWGFTALVVFVAVIGKFGGGALAARFMGENWRDSLTIGALMNTRGLMELVVLNIGLDLGVISPTLFTMMVIMALVTTVMTGPALAWIERLLPQQAGTADSGTAQPTSKPVVVAFGRIDTARSLLKLAKLFAADEPVLALHVIPDAGRSARQIEDFMEANGLELAERVGRQEIAYRYVPQLAPDVTRAIQEESRRSNASVLLVGAARTVFSGGPLGGRIGELVSGPGVPTGVLIGQVPEPLRTIVVVREDPSDQRLLRSIRAHRGSDLEFRVRTLKSAGQVALPSPWKADRGLRSVAPETLFVMERDLFDRFGSPGPLVLLMHRIG